MNFTKMMISFFLLFAMAVVCFANEAEIVNEIAEAKIEDAEIDATDRSFRPHNYKTVICKSSKYHPRVCDVGEKIDKLWLLKEFSYRRCFFWKTYFQRKTSVLVKDGCAAKFAYTVKKPVVFKITCTSFHLKKNVCYINGRVDRVYIHKVLSKYYPCILGKTYWIKGNRIVVTWGCSAIFSYTLKH